MRRLPFVFLSVLLLAAAPAVPPADFEFAKTASMANLYEIKAGELARDKATHGAYKEFARTMVKQHTEIGDSYVPIAKAQGLPMPTALAGDFKTMYDQLEAAWKWRMHCR